MADIIRFILGVISAVLMTIVVIIVILGGIFIVIPYVIIMRLLGKKVAFNAQTPFSTFIRNNISRQQPQSPPENNTYTQKETIRYKENHDPDVIDVKATIVEKE